MIIKKPQGDVEIVVSEKKYDTFVLTFKGTTFEAYNTFRETKGQIGLSLKRDVKIDGRKFNMFGVTSEQMRELKNMMQSYNESKEKEIIEFAKNVDLLGVRLRSVREVRFYDHNEATEKIYEYEECYDRSFVDKAIKRYALARYDEETDYEKEAGLSSILTLTKLVEKQPETPKAPEKEMTPEKRALLNKMYEDAETMSDEHFEEMYDVPRSYYL